MNRKELNALLIRLVVTFVQGFLAVWAASGFNTDQVVLGGAVAAGASLVYNIVIKPQLEKLSSVQGA
jgi:hypothetical protein